MRIKGQKYDTIKAAFIAVVEASEGASKLRGFYGVAGLSEARLLWDIWRVAHNNLQYDDTHPFYIDGRWKRIVPYDASFSMYSNGDNDEHFYTALRHIAKGIGLVD